MRDPLPTLASFKRVGLEGGGTAYFDASEAGFREAALLKERIVDACGAPPLAIDADAQLLANPQATLEGICAHVGIPYEPAMLQWKAYAARPPRTPDGTRGLVHEG